MTLAYKVEHKSPDRSFYSLIAAFDCQRAAEGYAGECALSNPEHCYRVKKGRTVLGEFKP